MSSDIQLQSLKVVFKPSQSFAALLLFTHSVVAAVVYLTAIPLPARLALFLLITLSLFYHLVRDVLLLHPNSWRELILLEPGESVLSRNGSGLIVQRADRAIVSPYFVVLRINLGGHHQSASRVIFPDALAPGAFRELCVFLKYS